MRKAVKNAESDEKRKMKLDFCQSTPLEKILKDHFSDCEECDNDLYAKQYGTYRIIRIKEAVETFLKCGDYSKGIDRIKCANPHWGHEYFRPFVASLKGGCKSWYLCPTCDPQDVGSAGEDRISKSLLTRKGSCFSRSTSQKTCS